MSSEQLKQKFKRLPKNVQKILNHINVDGMKLIGRCKNPEAKKQMRSILREIDFIHLHFDESEGELIEIAKELLGPYRNKYIRALAIFVPKQGLPEASSSTSTKRKRNSGADGGNKKSKRQ
ncbi:hypothetical protein Glove_365g147 [Diversispora epigaea]|uniref:Uncharacterized protein n=1 Tax=Diversispora epigaea TaxID=1348612 RepID=A0A397H8V9_9GLOM|nr:hypothetical protein Glove_365g147 [Diversispora epigaea]